MDAALHNLLLQALRTLYVLAAPLVLVLFVAGSIASIMQSALSVQEATMNYAVRLIAFVLLVYLLFPTMVQTLSGLMVQALQ